MKPTSKDLALLQEAGTGTVVLTRARFKRLVALYKWLLEHPRATPELRGELSAVIYINELALRGPFKSFRVTTGGTGEDPG